MAQATRRRSTGAQDPPAPATFELTSEEVEGLAALYAALPEHLVAAMFRELDMPSYNPGLHAAGVAMHRLYEWHRSNLRS